MSQLHAYLDAQKKKMWCVEWIFIKIMRFPMGVKMTQLVRIYGLKVAFFLKKKLEIGFCSQDESLI